VADLTPKRRILKPLVDVWQPSPQYDALREVTSKPHWWMTDAMPDDNGCSWVVSEDEGVIYATER